MEIRPREAVILASDFSSLVAWYRDVLGFLVQRLFEEDYRYCNLETPSGLRIGVADAGQMGVEPGDRRRNTVLLQLEVDDVAGLLQHVAAHGGAATFGPSRDAKDGFWYGGFADPEGKPFWVVDARCP